MSEPESLVERLKAHGQWYYPPHDPGNYMPEKGTFTPDTLAHEAATALSTLRSRCETAEAERYEAVAALKEIFDGHHDGSFLSKRAYNIARRALTQPSGKEKGDG